MSELGAAAKAAEKFVKDTVHSGGKFLEGNKGINKAFEFLGGEKSWVAEETGEMLRHGTGIQGLVQDFNSTEKVGFKDMLKNSYTDGRGNLNKKAIAGSYITANLALGAASRVTGQHNKNGGVDIPLVPFV